MRGTPFRVFLLVSAGRSARRARAEITSPTLFCWVVASSLAAASTSSSIASVVLIQSSFLLVASDIKHHTSLIVRIPSVPYAAFPRAVGDCTSKLSIDRRHDG